MHIFYPNVKGKKMRLGLKYYYNLNELKNYKYVALFCLEFK